MLGSYGDRLSCGNCRKPYDCSKVNGVPLYLQCGCTFCYSCLKRLPSHGSYVRCPACWMVTKLKPDCPLEVQLMPDVYLMGMVVANSLCLPRIPTKDSWLWNKARMKALPFHGKLVSSVSKCEECLVEVATVRCSQCAVDYCTPCNQQIHAAGLSLRRHTSVPITRARSAAYACPAHPNQTKHYYCRKDGMLVCSECALGNHKGHDTCGVTEAVRIVRMAWWSHLINFVGRGASSKTQVTVSEC